MRKSSAKETPSWWHFTGAGEAFEARDPDRISRLYFPLCNEAGLLSAITPTLNGDIKTGQNQFLGHRGALRHPEHFDLSGTSRQAA